MTDATTVDRPGRVLIVAQQDGYANGVRPQAIAGYLQGRGHEVVLLDTRRLSRAGTGRFTRLPSPRPLRTLLYVVEVLLWLLGRLPPLARRLSYPLLVGEQALRRRILRPLIRTTDADLVLCETPHDSGALLDITDRSTLYDCPTPWADELAGEGRLTARQLARTRQRERAVFDSVDVLTFHWRTYGPYVRDHYGATGHNLRVLDMGCRPAARRARHATPPRVVYMGSLSGRFINLPLLAELTHRYPFIHVYGGPAPDPALGLDYRGYASPEVLTDYQLGLVTCTDDELRREGFSAKHLEYLAAGLPVLVPRWRRHLELLGGSVPYDPASFAETVERFADPTTWAAAADEAWKQAHDNRWDLVLRPLDDVVADAVDRRAGASCQIGPTARRWCS